MAESARKPTILLITTGGTISMVRDPHTGRSVPTLTAANLLAHAALAAAVEVQSVALAQQPGPSRQPADLLALAHAMQQAAKGAVDGIVVTHGTDAMEEVAYLIDEVVPAPVPIVFTGAMRPSWAAGYDGIRNLENAIRVATTVPAEYGTLVTLNDEIFEAWNVYKADTGALDAFAARRGAPRGRIFGDQVEFAWRPVPRVRLGRIPPSLPATVPILTMGVADNAVLLDQFSRGVGHDPPYEAVQGVVIAGMAAGSVPPVARKRILSLAESGLPVVLCSSAASGRTAEDYYYPGAYEDLRGAGVAIEDWLTPRKARIRLLLSLGLRVPYVPFGKEFVI